MTMTTQQPSAVDVLMGGGGAATAKFDAPGVTVGGRIVAEPRTYQERKYDQRNPGNGAPKFFPSGDPIWAISVDVQTDLREHGEDDGVRRIYVEGKRMKDAVRAAVREAGARGLDHGGQLWVTHTGLGVSSGADMNAPKEYTARYVPPPSAANTVLMGEAPTPPPQQAPAQAQQAPSSGGPQRPPAIGEAVWAGMDPATREAVARMHAATSSDTPPF